MNPLSTLEPWELVAPGYTTELVPVFQKWTADSLRNVPLKPGDEVIDVACGPGTVAMKVAPLVHQVQALDFSPAMIAACEMQLRLRQIENVHPRICDCLQLPFENNRFDAGFSQFGLMFFTDRPKGFSELFRVLKPGGIVSVSSWAPVERSEAMTLMLDALDAGFRQFIPKPEDNRSIVRGLDDLDIFFAELKDAGFVAVDIEESAHSFSAETPERFWKSMVSSSAPLALLRTQLTESQWEEGELRAIESVRAQLMGRKKLFSTAYLAHGRKP